MRRRILENMSSLQHASASVANQSQQEMASPLIDESDPWHEKAKAGLLDAERLKAQATIFHVPLAAYPMQPWARAVQQLKRGSPQDVQQAMTNLQQWFNYEMTPAAWEAYAAAQREGAQKLKK